MPNNNVNDHTNAAGNNSQPNQPKPNVLSGGGNPNSVVGNGTTVDPIPQPVTDDEGRAQAAVA